MTTIEAVLPAPAAEARAADDLLAVSTRSFGRPGRIWWLLFSVCSAALLVGLVAWIYQLRNGLGVAGLNDHAFWAVYIADVVTFIGVSYGGAVISAILRLTGASWRAPLTRLAEGMAVVTVLIGAAFIIPHLGRPDRIWELVTRPNLSSPLFWDFLAISTYTLGSIVFFVLPLIPDMARLHRDRAQRLGWRDRLYARVSRGWVGAAGQRRVFNRSMTLVAIMIIPLAVSVHSVLAWAFALVSRPWWHDSIWAPYFVVAALYSGVGMVILVVAAFRRAYHLESLIDERHFVRLGYILVAFAAAYLYLTFADILPDAYVGERAPSVIFQALLFGQYAPWFWIFVVGAGVLPVLLVAIPRTRNITGMVVASAFVVPSMWLKRMVMVLDPSTFDRITNTFGSYHFTWVSVSITLAGVAAIPLLLMLMFRVVPLLSVNEIEEASHGDATPHDGDGERPLHVSALRPALAGGGSGGHRALAVATATAIALGAVILTASTGPPVRAASLPGGSPAAAHLVLTGTDSAAGVQLTATLTTASGAPLGGAVVEFLERTTEFSPQGQLVPLDSATTDASGVASLTYRAAIDGDQDFVARYGSEKTAVTSAVVTVAVGSAAGTYQPAPAKPLAGAGDVLVVVLLVTVALVWITLLAQMVRVRRACRSAV